MAKELTFSRNQFSGEVIAPGVYLSKGTIVKVRNVAGMKTFEAQKDPYEFGIQMAIKVEGRDEPFNFTVDGRFQRGEDGKTIIGAGTAFRVHNVFFNLGYEGNFKAVVKVPEEALVYLVGKSVYKIGYTKGLKENGKHSYSDFGVLYPATDMGKAKIIAEWEKQRSKGYPKNYVAPLNGHSTLTPAEAAFPPAEAGTEAQKSDW